MSIWSLSQKMEVAMGFPLGSGKVKLCSSVAYSYWSSKSALNASRGSSCTGSWTHIPIDLFGNFFKYPQTWSNLFTWPHEDSKWNDLRMRHHNKTSKHPNVTSHCHSNQWLILPACCALSSIVKSSCSGWSPIMFGNFSSLWVLYWCSMHTITSLIQ